MTQTNVFGNYETQRESKNKCEKYLFDNDLEEFNKLSEYSISDLVNTSGNINDYNKLFSSG